MTKKLPPSTDWRRPAWLGYAIIVLTFGVVGGWTAYAQLDSAIVAQGVVSVETNRKTVQHLEGGIIREIRVREGQRVKAGDVLFRLDNTQASANAEAIQNQLGALRSTEARLLSERSGSKEIEFPQDLLNSDRDVVKTAIADQRKQFAERRDSLAGQVAILESRIQQFQTEIEGLQREKTATEQQLGYIEDELSGLKKLLERNLVQKSRVLALEREKSRLEGVVGRSVADASKALNSIGEANLQVKQLRQKFLEDVNSSILETRQKISELTEKGRIAHDVLQRIDIVAPRTGEAQNLRVSTIGGVVRAGEPLVDIVPENEALIIQAQISPNDVESVRAGMRADIRFPSFHTKVLPAIFGQITTVSKDRLTDEQSKQPYFLARIAVADRDVPREIKGKLTAGMPAEVMVPTGERTVASYLVRPLENRFRKALREQ
jgi:HlyD family type I secretion membrane fusion protein